MNDGDSFADLPDALVAELLDAAEGLGRRVSERITSLVAQKESLRSQARQASLIQARADLDVVREPSVAAIDGSYQIHRLTSLDLAAAAAVGVEGTAKEERRKWDLPHHRMWLDVLPHSDVATNGVRGVMVGMELELATIAPHDLVLIDGAFSPLVIYLNQSQGARSRAPAGLRTWLDSKWDATKDALLAAISGDRIVAVPKYATRNELGERLNIDSTQLDGKTLATVILEPGEYTEPIPVYDRDPDYHLAGLSRAEAKQLSQDMAQIQVIYFRPYGWLPAIRLEVPHRQAVNLHRRALILEGIARQLFTPAVFEPYPLFLADRMVKSLGVGVNVVEQAISQHVVGEATDAEEALLFLRQHRTDGGRGS